MRAKFHVRTTIFEKEPQWIICFALNDEAKELINGKIAAIRPFTDRFSENVMKRASGISIMDLKL